MQAGLTGVADRVNIGLIPSSEEGWPLACAALKQSTGGWLHVHGNVTLTVAGDRERNDQSAVYQQDLQRYSHLLSLRRLRSSTVTRWIGYAVEQVILFLQLPESKDEDIASVCQNWSVEARHVEHVKSYAPHISHLVLDLECRPVPS